MIAAGHRGLGNIVKMKRQDAQVVLGIVLISLLFSAVLCEQRIVKHPSATAVIAGQSALLECQVAEKAGSLQWSKGGFAMGSGDFALRNYPRYSMEVNEANGDYNLRIVNVTLEDDDTFNCQLGFGADGQAGVPSNDAQLTVYLPPDKPAIQPDGDKLEVVAGVATNLSCKADNGKPGPDFTFLLDNTEMTGLQWKEPDQVQGDKRVNAEGCLQYTALKLDQGKKLKCQVNNPALSAPLEDEVTVEVLYAPEVTVTVVPLKERYKEGETISFKCQASANPADVSWRWFLDDKEITGETNSGDFYEITNIDRGYHDHKISCEATNVVGPGKSDFGISMTFGPRFGSITSSGPEFKDKPEDVATDIGATATLKCDVSGNPTPRIIWTKKDSSTVLSIASTFVIKEVTQEDIGTYECTAGVDNFMDIRAEVNLFLKGPPKISGEKETRALQGEDTVIICTALSIPRPEKMKWFRDGKPLGIDQFDRYSVKEEDTSSGRRSLISIMDVHSNDYGTYNCTVVNSYGMDTSTIKLVQIDAVPMAYVIGGVCAGVVLMVIIAIGIFCYHKRKAKERAGGSDTSSEIDKKREEGVVKMEYIGREGPLEPWRADYNRDHYRYSAEYDELKYPDHRPPPNGYGPPPGGDYPDGYSTYPADYGNGPLPPSQGYDNSMYGSQYPPPRSDRSYGPGPQTPVIETGYGPAPQQGPPSDRGYGPGPQSPVYHINGMDNGYGHGPQVSRLSTNV